MNSSFSRLLLDGLDEERHGRCQSQYGPFRVVFRLAGIPHLDEIAPRGVRLYGIEIRLDIPREHYRHDARCFPSVLVCAT